MLMALDGVVENPHLWTVQFRSEESQKYKFDELFASDALLLGRITYQDFATGWPGVTGAYAEKINSMSKYVPTSTLQEAEWNATLIKHNVGEEVTRLKQEPGQDILIFGSVELIHSLMQEDLIDEYRLMLFPIVVGNGKRFFHDESQQKDFKLVQSQTFGSGVVVLTYEPNRKFGNTSSIAVSSTSLHTRPTVHQTFQEYLTSPTSPRTGHTSNAIAYWARHTNHPFVRSFSSWHRCSTNNTLTRHAKKSTKTACGRGPLPATGRILAADQSLNRGGEAQGSQGEHSALISSRHTLPQKRWRCAFQAVSTSQNASTHSQSSPLISSQKSLENYLHLILTFTAREALLLSFSARYAQGNVNMQAEPRTQSPDLTGPDRSTLDYSTSSSPACLSTAIFTRRVSPAMIALTSSSCVSMRICSHSMADSGEAA